MCTETAVNCPIENICAIFSGPPCSLCDCGDECVNTSVSLAAWLTVVHVAVVLAGDATADTQQGVAVAVWCPPDMSLSACALHCHWLLLHRHQHVRLHGGRGKPKRYQHLRTTCLSSSTCLCKTDLNWFLGYFPLSPFSCLILGWDPNHP